MERVGELLSAAIGGLTSLKEIGIEVRQRYIGFSYCDVTANYPIEHMRMIYYS